MEKSYSPTTVPLDVLAAAAAAGVDLALQDQAQATAPIGPTTGIFPQEPVWL
jgi:hypothetical protein